MSALTEASNRVITAAKTVLIVSGAIAAIVGVLILVWPEKVAVALTLIIAIYTLVAGLLYLALTFVSKDAGVWQRIGSGLLGVIYIVAAIVAFANLQVTAAVLAVVLATVVGILWIVEGIITFVLVRNLPSKLWPIIYGILSVVAGVLLIISPLWGALVLGWFIGFSLLVLGVVQIVRAITLRAA